MSFVLLIPLEEILVLNILIKQFHGKFRIFKLVRISKKVKRNLALVERSNHPDHARG